MRYAPVFSRHYRNRTVLARREPRKAALPLLIVLWRIMLEKPLFLAACYTADNGEFG
jgi:hypothetical protein